MGQDCSLECYDRISTLQSVFYFFRERDSSWLEGSFVKRIPWGCILTSKTDVQAVVTTRRRYLVHDVSSPV